MHLRHPVAEKHKCAEIDIFGAISGYIVICLCICTYMNISLDVHTAVCVRKQTFLVIYPNIFSYLFAYTSRCSHMFMYIHNTICVRKQTFLVIYLNVFSHLHVFAYT